MLADVPSKKEKKKKEKKMKKEKKPKEKKVKEKNSAMNQRILGDFASKLPYTRLGNAEYMSVYQFIANPLSAADRSGNPVAD